MAAPTGASFKWRPGSDGAPTNDVDDIIGAISASELTADADGQLIAPGEADVAGGSSRIHYGGAYISNEEGAGGSLLNGYLWLANGALTIPGNNTLLFTDPTGENEDLEIVVGGIVDGSPHVETITIESGSAETTVTWDIGTRWWWGTVDDAAISGVDGTDDIIVTCGATQVAKVRAPLAGVYANGCRTGGSIWEMAVADTYGTSGVPNTLAAEDRLTAPTLTSGSLSTFNSGAHLTGTDHRHALGTFADATNKAYALKKVIPAGLQMPKQGLFHYFLLSGIASA